MSFFTTSSLDDRCRLSGLEFCPLSVYNPQTDTRVLTSLYDWFFRFQSAPLLPSMSLCFVRSAFRDKIEGNLLKVFSTSWNVPSPYTSKSHESAAQQCKSQSGTYMFHDICIRLVLLLGNHLSKFLIEFIAFRREAPRCCEHKWHKYRFLDLDDAFIVFPFLLVFILLVFILVFSSSFC